MKELPILFSTPMVQALLDGRKTKTRRTKGLERINEHPDDWEYMGLLEGCFCFKNKKEPTLVSFIPKLLPGDLLWVRETYSPSNALFRKMYKASIDAHTMEQFLKMGLKWKPSIFMPKDAARIWLKVTSVKCERLQDISEADAIAEGVEEIKDLPGKFKHYCPEKYYTKEKLADGLAYAEVASVSFFYLWQSINGKDSFVHNPWVFAYTFEVVSTNGRVTF